MSQGFAIVIDIGKTLSKISLWSREGVLLRRETRPNDRVVESGIRRLDATGIGNWLIEVLHGLADHPVEWIIPVAHGAGVAAIRDGTLAFSPLDYEQELPAPVRAAYRKLRPSFRETGSPALPAGLNLGAQLFWLEQLYPRVLSGAVLMPWAQYWAWFLSGVPRTEMTSLGCHSDLWAPASGDYSTLAKDKGWAERFAPLAAAGSAIGRLKPAIATRTGLPPSAQILAGLHDSNAALLAARGFHQIEHREATVLSTGTWFVAMRLAEQALDLSALPEARDCLVNVDPSGRPVPSARLMGGREIEALIELDTRQVDIKPDQPALLQAVPAVLRTEAMVLPTHAPGNGPFPSSSGGWRNRPDDWHARRAAACLYAALVTDAALDLIGSRDCLLVEGRFSEAEVFVRGLATLRPATAVFVANSHNDVSFGALRLVDPALHPAGELRRVEPLAHDLTDYRSAWYAAQRVAA